MDALVIHHVFANRSNIGDWLSARGIQALLGVSKIAEHLCDEPFVPETLTALAQAGHNGLIVIGGGGLFMDYFAPFWEGFREIADRVPFCIWGVGYCDLKREPSRAPQALLEEIVGKSRLCVVRDELTRGYLSACELPPPVPCPSINAVQPPMRPGLGLLHVDNYTTAGADVYEAMDVAGREFARRTGRPYRQTNNRIDDGEEAALTKLLHLYASSDLVLSSALHGCILAVAMGRRVLAVSGDYKIEAFMQAAGLGDWICDINDTAVLPERLADLPDQSPQLEFVARVRRENQAVAEYLKTLAPSAVEGRSNGRA
jgi:polysaccharide pyruvyl transferase WcaK-like protein